MDTNDGKTDMYERNCDFEEYITATKCGNFNDDDFNSNMHCCACGGGRFGNPVFIP